jgi:hypothetical protein
VIERNFVRNDPKTQSAMCRIFSVWLIVIAGCGPAVEIGGTLEIGEGSDSAVQTPPVQGPRREIPPGCPSPTLESIREQIFIPTCAKAECHVGPSAPEMLDLTLPLDALAARLSETSHQSVSGLALIEPGQYGASWLYLKVTLGQMPPPPAEKIPECELAAIREWIAAGAP